MVILNGLRAIDTKMIVNNGCGTDDKEKPRLHCNLREVTFISLPTVVNFIFFVYLA